MSFLFLFPRSDNTTGMEDVTGSEICSYTEWIPRVFWIFLTSEDTALASLERKPGKVTLMERGVRVHISRHAHCCHLPRASPGHIGCKPSPRIGFKNSCFICGKICPPLRKLSSLSFLIYFPKKERAVDKSKHHICRLLSRSPIFINCKKRKRKKIGKFWKQSFLNPSGAIAQSFFSALLPAEDHG